MYFGDAVMLHWLWKETVNKLEFLSRSVHEGRAVDEASSFARWLSFSGLIKIFEAYPSPAPLRVDGGAVRALTYQLTAACGEIHKGGKAPFNPSLSRVDEANAKLDIILSALAKSAATTNAGPAAGQPAVSVVTVRNIPALASSSASSSTS